MPLYKHAIVTRILDVLELAPPRIRRPIYDFLRSIWLRLVWHPHAKHLELFFSQFITEGSLVFDIGANKGMLTEIFLRLGARVVCVEPLPFCTDILTSKFGNNTRVSIVPKGISNAEGQLNLFINEKNPALSTFSDGDWRTGFLKDERWTKRVLVPVITLDALIKEYGVPQFCKIDVEGFEFRALSGLSTPIRYMSFEFIRKRSDDIAKCIERLTALGNARFSYCDENAGQLAIDWADQETLLAHIARRQEPDLIGDIYVSFSS